jgi:hypothetical protein
MKAALTSVLIEIETSVAKEIVLSDDPVLAMQDYFHLKHGVCRESISDYDLKGFRKSLAQALGEELLATLVPMPAAKS